MTDERRWFACGFGVLLMLAGCSSKNNASGQTGSGGQSSSATGGTGTATGGTGATAGTSAAGSGVSGAGQAGTKAASGGSGGNTMTGGKGGSQPGTGGGGGQAGTLAATGGSGGQASNAGAGGGGGSSAAGLTLTSTAFKDGSKIDAKYRCTGPSPDLQWSGAPDGTKSFALILEDVTPGGFSMGFLHWVIYDIPMSVSMLPEMVPIGYAPASPAGAHQAPIWNNTVGFNGPCAPSGTNTYELTLYALDTATLSDLNMSSTGMAAATAIDMHKLKTAKLTIMSSP